MPVTPRRIDFSSTPTEGILPNGYYDVVITAMDERRVREESTMGGCLMYVIEYTVESPAVAAGKRVSDFCVFGTRPFNTQSSDKEYAEYSMQDDPDAVNPLTWRYSRGIRLFKTIMDCTGYEMSGPVDMADVARRCDMGNMRLGINVQQTESSRDPGRKVNNVSLHYRRGEHAPAITQSPRQTATPQQSSPATRQRVQQAAAAPPPATDNGEPQSDLPMSPRQAASGGERNTQSAGIMYDQE